MYKSYKKDSMIKIKKDNNKGNTFNNLKMISKSNNNCFKNKYLNYKIKFNNKNH